MLQLKKLKQSDDRKLTLEESGEIIGGIFVPNGYIITTTEDGGWSCGGGGSLFDKLSRVKQD